MDLKKLTDRAKGLVEKRGGTDSLKEDAGELQGIAKGEGSFTDKAKAAVAAIKDPGDEDTARPAPAPESPAEAAEEAERSADMVEGEHRGRQGHGGHGRGGQGRHRGGRDGGPAV